MHCTLSPENTILLDKLIKSTKTEMISIEVDSIFQIYLISPDLSQLTIIKLEPSFFESFENTVLIQVSFPVRKLYKQNIKALQITLNDYTINLEYIFNAMKHTQTFDCLEAEIFDLDFQCEREIEIKLPGLKRILREIKDKQIKIEMKDSFKISGQHVEISIPQTNLDVDFTVDTEKFKSIVKISDHFYTIKFNLPAEISPLNITMEAPEIFLSTFISIE
ncbi:uncharacterized protein VICG_01904 [Vittaforma corneae ATCC 50505]|uniref:Proliferating cell nuclear antigen n=1 Tax=Vittaforma corneae (strain ATCC 50505) TaxID=993615 RepID=L2GL46_VITCO|nr:uncharacterized protein VICG_01904 [Vittaforma corneae ATCC 50505]ELA41022.1 hypothetical protein VICG_01904 [Vittaforma corneae ATCC 50505]